MKISNLVIGLAVLGNSVLLSVAQAEVTKDVVDNSSQEKEAATADTIQAGNDPEEVLNDSRDLWGGKKGKRGGKRGRKPKPRPKPTPKPRSPPICFSGVPVSTVELEGGLKIPMNKLKILDKVLVGSGEYQPVYSFSHKEISIRTKFFQIYTTIDSKPLELSETHMVFLQDNDIPVRADTIKVGDSLQVPNNKKEKGAKVTKIKKVVRKGLYAPLTYDGTIVVNGIVASNFIGFGFEPYMRVGGISTGLTVHGLSRMFQAPHRVYCTMISPTQCQDETYDHLGFSFWNGLAVKIAVLTHVTAKDYPILQIILFYAVAIPTICFYGMERLVANSWPFLLLLALGLMAFKKKNEGNKKKEKVM